MPDAPDDGHEDGHEPGAAGRTRLKLQLGERLDGDALAMDRTHIIRPGDIQRDTGVIGAYRNRKRHRSRVGLACFVCLAPADVDGVIYDLSPSLQLDNDVNEWVIGRSASQMLPGTRVIPVKTPFIPLFSRTVSRAHARMVREADGKWLVTDVSGSNRMRLNGIQIAEAYLGDADVLTFGEVDIAFELDPALAGRFAARGEERSWWQRLSSRPSGGNQ